MLTHLPGFMAGSWTKRHVGIYEGYGLEHQLHRNGLLETAWPFSDEMRAHFQAGTVVPASLIHSPDFGVCDHWTQILTTIPRVTTDPRRYVVEIRDVTRAEQPHAGGWRWHKWGDYIGVREPQCEYLYDEPLIEKVTLFHIMEVREF